MKGLKTTAALAIATLGLLAQTPAQAPPEAGAKPGTISGTVTDTAGNPAEGVSVRISPSRNRENVSTGKQGRYDIRDVKPGRYRVQVFDRSFSGQTRAVEVAPGQKLQSVDFRLQAYGEITGRVLDENDEPVPDMVVYLVGTEYQLRATRYTFRYGANTDDQGEYRMQRVTPGVPYQLLATGRKRVLPAISEVPLDPKLRRPAFTPTYYPHAISLDSAERLVLSDGEVREGIDIRIARSPSLCIEGVLQAQGAPAILQFGIAETQPSNGYYSGGGLFGSPPGGTTGPDGKFRICDLHPGEYRFEVSSPSDTRPHFYGRTTVAVAREDVRDLTVPALPLLPFSGEVAWYAEAPEKPVKSQVTIETWPVYRAPFMGETYRVESELPGAFSISGLRMDDYEIRIRGLPPEYYVKDITYGGLSVHNRMLRLGSAVGDSPLRILIGHDSAYIHAQVQDEDAKPVTDSNVFILPASSPSEADLAAELIYAPTDQYGVYRSNALPPGKYYVLAADLPRDLAPETIGKLWQVKVEAAVVELEAEQTQQLTIEPIVIE